MEYAFPQRTPIQPRHRDTWLEGDIIDYSSDSISGFHQLQPLFKYNPKRGMIVYPPLSLSLWQKIQKKKYNYQFIWAPYWEYTVHLGSRCEVSVSSQDCSLCHDLETGERMVRQLGWSIIPKTHHSVLSLSPGRTHLFAGCSQVHISQDLSSWAWGCGGHFTSKSQQCTRRVDFLQCVLVNTIWNRYFCSGLVINI